MLLCLWLVLCLTYQEIAGQLIDGWGIALGSKLCFFFQIDMNDTQDVNTKMKHGPR
jgi:hypothetical protein